LLWSDTFANCFLSLFAARVSFSTLCGGELTEEEGGSGVVES
jgi:hypothetical protein